MSGVLILAGPTASGKTDLAIELARRFDAEIIGADSRQIYAGMPVGTAAPNEMQLSAVPHHLTAFLEPYERYSAARFAQDAVAKIQHIHARGRRAIVVGGTGFYIRALTGAVELAAAHDEELRARLAHEARVHDPEFLHEWLMLRDAPRAGMLQPRDTYRVLRALEVALAPGHGRERERPLPTLAVLGIPFLKVFLDVNVEQLVHRIERRTDAMLEHGLLEEAERVGANAVASSAVGYPQALAYLRGESTYQELRTTLIRATRRYAKRQQMWFRSEPQTTWAPPDAVERLAREKLDWL
ncbi:MAG: tRNA (adenosine(37)-N6)-dimethylallyltransferase MiaA [Candidatus Eremiobacteraeota bacterium]|nr:tRNA (adenosine(37)-N6)-dimethylallyltransferase MiaA [Candidatus Eremiobacteraeota bacterium]